MAKLTCPLLSMSTGMQRWECDQQKCCWWINTKDFEGCSIKGIAFYLQQLSAAIGGYVYER